MSPLRERLSEIALSRERDVLSERFSEQAMASIESGVHPFCLLLPWSLGLWSLGLWPFDHSLNNPCEPPRQALTLQ
jgi:hypothetical protein